MVMSFVWYHTIGNKMYKHRMKRKRTWHY